MPSWGWISIGIAAVVVVVAAVVAGRRRDPVGGVAESEFPERQARDEQLVLTPLDADEREGYLEQWRTAQERFVEDPHGAAVEADHLVLAVMRARGYPVEAIDRRAADVSGDGADLLAGYRSAHDITVRQAVGQASTGDLRNAMRHYRALFDELLETGAAERLRVR